MSELGDRLRRHVEGASPAIDIQDVMVPRRADRAWFRRVAAAAVVVAVARGMSILECFTSPAAVQ